MEKETLIKNELQIEEQKKKQKTKKLYKNWKTYAIASGIIVIGTGTGLGIYYGVSANSDSGATTPTVTEQDIVNQINGATYETAVAVNSKASAIKIDAAFIQTQLTDDINQAFNANNFSFKSIMVGNQELNDTDLTKSGQFNANIVYTYGSAIEQKTTLTITVTGIDNNQIIAAINQASYTKEVVVKTAAKDIKIDAEFIKTQLSDIINQAFDDRAFNFTKITVENNDFDDTYLTNPGLINANIVYTYGSAIEQQTTLTINVKTIEEIVNDAISEKEWVQTAWIDIKAHEFAALIDRAFFQAGLAQEGIIGFDDNKLTDITIKVAGQDLSDNHLNKLTDDEVKPIKATIEYTYDTFKNQTANLTIEITPRSFDGADVSKVTIDGRNTTLSQLKEEITIDNIVDNADFRNSINAKINSKTLVLHKPYFAIENFYHDAEGTIVAVEEDIVQEGTTLYLKVVGSGKLTGSVLIKLVIPAQS